MSRKKIKWYGPSIKSLLLSGLFMFVAKLFLRGIEKQAERGSSRKISKKQKTKK